MLARRRYSIKEWIFLLLFCGQYSQGNVHKLYSVPLLPSTGQAEITLVTKLPSGGQGEITLVTKLSSAGQAEITLVTKLSWNGVGRGFNYVI